MPLAGQIVGDGVRLIRPVGRGSHSLVYFAVARDGQPCAVKIFPAHLSGYADREYQHAHDLHHPRLVRVLHRAVVDDQPALVGTLARGEVMFQRFTQRPAALTERRAFLLTIVHLLDALAYLHGRGLVHRDIKPENIMVDEDGSAKLVDFDLSGPAFETFDTPVRMGTAAFQSPEAARGEPLGPESDLYGVGVLLGWGIHGSLPDPDEPHAPSGDPLGSLHASLIRPHRAERPNDAGRVRQELLRLAQLPY
ncbi:serine/threonine-protein kinase [Deinococcus sp. A31D244]|uniref:Serine/threonine-protein kinase n=1 Tax=Deinococcus aquaticus TaxID=328692 RepID=A0ABY7V1M6_9DEIO|nr:serine/threonine-protein kinase [Deinococcus aquaticus]WDA58731.1 serine/threonine-protein kinase [Deinococcus aquaticus]